MATKEPASSPWVVVGARIAGARNRRGWSQERLAREAGVVTATVYSMEKARRPTGPQMAKLYPVWEAVGLDIDELEEILRTGTSTAVPTQIDERKGERRRGA